MSICFFLLVLLGLISSSLCSQCGQGGIGHRVVGGKEAVPNNWPWQVSLSHRGWHMCGGTIVAPSWIVTAGHCFGGKLAGTADWVVTAGEHDLNDKSGFEQRRKIERLIIHPDYKGGATPNDIALIKLDRPMDYGKAKVGAACLPEANSDWDRNQRNCMLTGWGFTKGPQDKTKLQEVGGPIVDQRECGLVWQNQLKSTMLCFGTGLKGGCQGDSGGPLVCFDGTGWTHVGVVSFGVGKCKSEGIPTIFTRVSSFKKWIDRAIQVYGGPDGTGPEPELPKGIIGPRCKDSDGCSFFAKGGKCGTNTWLLTACPKECGLCLPCGDKDVFCSESVARGDCESVSDKTKTLMFKNCNHSCKLCL